MIFAVEMGPRALPRQFYLIPWRKHFNTWGADESALRTWCREIASLSDWSLIEPQFEGSFGLKLNRRDI
jgi:hypothetical protein